MKALSRQFFIFLMVTAGVLTAGAQRVTREEAHSRAEAFLRENGRQATLTVAAPQQTRSKGSDAVQAEASACHVFNIDGEQGFVVMAADECLPQQVLAYSDNGAWDWERLNPGVKVWVETLERQTEWLRKHPEALSNLIRKGKPLTPKYTAEKDAPSRGILKGVPRRKARAAVSPLVKTKWGQSAPYNGRLGDWLTGCGATAMAQVMSVYRSPSSVQTAIPGYTTQSLKAVMPGIEAGTPINWEKILDDYSSGSSSKPQKNAVADLMLYCGTSVEMDYGRESSGSSINMIAIALKKYFGYYQGIRMRYHEDYDNASWEELIYSEIAAGRPVLMAGAPADNSNDGHIFICDGYNTSGLFHVNWGWGGYQDGDFWLTDLMPPDVPPGYNFGQSCVTGVKPDDGSFTETPVLTTTNFLLYDIETGQETAQREYTRMPGSVQYPIGCVIFLTSETVNTYDYDFNIGVFDEKGELIEMLRGDEGVFQGKSMPYGMTAWYSFDYLPTKNCAKSFYSPGTYVLKGMSRKSGTTEWLVNEGSDKYCLVCVIDNDMKMTCSFGAPAVDPNPNPDPDPKPEVVSDAEKANLSSNVSELANRVSQGQQALADQRVQFASLLEEARKAVADWEALRQQIANVRKQVEESQLSNDTKENILRYIDNDVLTNFVGNEYVEPAAVKAVKKCEDAISEIDNRLSALSTISAQAEQLKAQVGAVSLLTEFNQLKENYQELSNSMASNQPLSVAEDLSEVLNLISSTQTNLKTAKESIIPDLESRISFQLKVEEELGKMQEAVDAVNGLLEAYNQTITMFNKLVQQFEEKDKKLTEAEKLLEALDKKLTSADLTDEQRTELRHQRAILMERFQTPRSADIDAYQKMQELRTMMPTEQTVNSWVIAFDQLKNYFVNANTEAGLEEVATRRVAFLQEVEQALNENAAIVESLKTLEHDIETLPESYDELLASVTEIEAAIEEAERLNAEEQQKLQAKKDQVRKMLDEVKQDIECFQADNLKIDQEYQRLNALLAEKVKAVETLQGKSDAASDQLTNADLTDVRRDSLTNVRQQIVKDVEKIQKTLGEWQVFLVQYTPISDPAEQLLSLYHEFEQQLDEAVNQEDLERIDGNCAKTRELLSQLMTSNLLVEQEQKSIAQLIDDLQTEIDKLQTRLENLSDGIEAAERLTAEERAQQEKEEQEKKLLEETREATGKALDELWETSENLAKRIVDMKLQAKVLETEAEVKALLEQLQKEEARMAELRNRMVEQKTEIAAASSREELQAISDGFSKYADDMAEVQYAVMRLSEQLETILTAVCPVKLNGRTVVGCYDTNGRPADIRTKGMKILRLSDGTIRKVFIK